MSTDPVVVNKNDNQGSQFYNVCKGLNGPTMNGPNGDYSHQQNSHYNPYGQPVMRGGYPQNTQPRGGMAGSMPTPNSSMMPPHSNYNPNQQRVMGGGSVPSGGSTPTLNQLLQSPNNGQRYPQPNYGDYGQQKNTGQDIMGGNPNYTNQSWSNQQRPMNPYQQQQQMQGNPAFRNQGQMYGNRPNMGSGYTNNQQENQFGQFSPNNQRFPVSSGKPGQMGGQSYNQQMSQGFNSSSGSMGYNQSSHFVPSSHGPGVMAPSNQQGAPAQMSPSQSSSHATPPPHPAQPSPGPPLKPPDDHSRPSSQQSDANAPPMTNGIDALSLRGDESNDSSIHSQKQDGPLFSNNTEDHHQQMISNSNNSDSQHNNLKRSSSSSSNTPTTSSSSQHNSVQSLRPPPSPAGSTGSRSTTPHSVTGNQAGSPMPPRPPSNQVDGPGRITSPMNQGYANSQMMPPPMGPNQMGYGTPNKMPPNSNMMSGGQMGSHYNQQHYPNPPGSYGRGPMPAYGGQPNYNGPNQMGGNHMYPNNMGGGMNRGGMQPSNYPGHYSQQPNSQGGMGGNTPQYSYNSQSSTNMPPGGGMPPAMQGHPGHVPHPGQQQPGPLPQNEQSSHSMQGPSQMHGGPPTSHSPHAVQSHRGQSPHMPPPSSQSSQPSHPSSQPSSHQQTTPPQPQQQPAPASTANIQPSSGPKGAQAAAHAAMVAASQQHLTRPGMNTPTSQAPGPPMGGAAPQQRPPFGQYPQSGGMQGYSPSQKPNMDNTSQCGSGGQYGYLPQPSNISGQSPSSMPSDTVNSGQSGQQSMAVGSNSMNYSSPSVPSSMGVPSQMGMPPHSGIGYGMNGGPSQHTTSSINNSLPPNAVAPTASSYGQNANNSMGPPNMPPPSMMPTTMKSEQAEPSQPGNQVAQQPPTSDIKSDVKPPIPTPQSTAGSVTTTTQSVTEPIMNSSVTSASPMGNSETTTSSVKPPTPQSLKQESIGTDESSQDSFKGPSKTEMTKQENLSLPPTLARVAPSPSIGSQQDEFENISSPSWPGTPGPQKASSDILQRQCEMGEEPERRPFLEQLFAFMDERGTAIQAMPQISKNYIDLYKLYVVVKEKGGLLEVTKNKKWREISTAINIGTSSSAGFTLKKNYCKLVFPFECKRDMGGIDPAPILAQVEAPQKKEKRGGPEFGRGGQGYDGYGMNHDMHQGPMMPPNVSMMPNQNMGGPYGQQGMMGNQGMGYQGNQGMMANQGMGYQGNQGMMGNQGMGYQGNQGMMGNQGMGYQGSQGMMSNQGMMGNQMQTSMMGSNSMGGQQGMASNSVPGSMPNTSATGQMIPSSAMMQNRGPTPGTINNDSNSNLSQPESFSGSEPSTTPNKQFPNSSMSSPVPPYSSSSQPPNPNSFGFSRNQGGSTTMPPFSSSANMTSSSKPSGQDSFPNTQYTGRMSSPFADSSSHSSTSPLPNQPGMQRAQGTEQNQMFAGRFGNQSSQPTTSQSGQSFSGQQQGYSQNQGYQGPPGSGTPMQRKPGMYPQQRPGYPQNMRRDAWGNMMQQGPRYPSMGGMQSSTMYSTSSSSGQPGTGFPQQQHPRLMGPRPEVKPGYQQPSGSMQKLPIKPQLSTTSYAPKKELVFPSDSVEATQPVLKKRKRLTYRDIGRVDPWRIMMALKSGQLLDSTWALDVLSVLLFDDHTVVYFGLQHMPGLLDVLLEHFRRHLSEIFGTEFEELEVQGKRRSVEEALVDQTSQEFPTNGQADESDGESDADSSDSDSDEPCEKRIQDLKTLFSGLKRKLAVDLPEAESLFAPGNHTLNTRCGKHVKIDKNTDNMHLAFDNKEWDNFEGFKCSRRRIYDLGKGDITLHIQTHMESDASHDVLRNRFYKRKSRVRKNAKNDINANTKTRDSTASSCDKIASEATCNISEKCDSQSRDLRTSSCLDERAPAIKTEPGVDCKEQVSVEQGCLEGKTVVDSDQSKTEQTSSCSSDSGIHVKSESSDGSVDVKVEVNCDVKTVKSETVPEQVENMKVSENVVKLEPGVSEFGSFKDSTSASNESDKLFLSHLKRKWEEGEVDNEEYRKDETPLCLLRDSQEEVARRCVCISNIIRSLSFIPGNDREMSHHRGLMTILGKLLLFRHRHNARSHDHRTFDKEVDTEIEDTMESGNEEWWWSSLDAVRENILVVLANISGQMNLSVFPEEICMPVLDGLLHWSICPSAYAQDPMPTMSPNSVLSPKKLVIETLAKLCVTDINVDLILATPPFSRIVNLFGSLIKSIADHSDAVLRELSLAILSYLVQGDSSAARAIALQHPAINLLLDFIESAEARTAQFVKAHGGVPKGDASELLGTSVDMLRKAAKTLSFLAVVPENKSLFLAKQERILGLAMSNCMDSKVVEYLSDVLYSCSQDAL